MDLIATEGLVPEVFIVQMPFPSTVTPNDRLSSYYQDYEQVYRDIIPSYFIPTGSLWELPLWVAHIAGLVKQAGYQATLIDLSKEEATCSSCTGSLSKYLKEGGTFLFSPLAQNFGLCLEVSRLIRAQGGRTIVGGNMAPFASPSDVNLVVEGIPDPSLFRHFLGGRVEGKVQGIRRSQSTVNWAPDYEPLTNYAGQVPLLRLNASHGCLFTCSFCGDAWSRSLMPVAKDALRNEVEQLRKLFPETKLFYIGDKTFGQSPEAVQNLLDVFDGQKYDFIVQTHVLQVTEPLVQAMKQLGVVMVELGFESGDSSMLKSMKKKSKGLSHYQQTIELIASYGIAVTLNVMGGLPEETESSHDQTIRFLRETSEHVALYNLYNFVPYPLVPDFERLRNRIVNWDFADWREDKPVVYKPTFISRERSWEMFMHKIEVCHDLLGTTLSGS